MKADGFGHERPSEGKTNDWITPQWIIQAFDSLSKDDNMFFDLDPCISLTQPWPTARKGYSIEQDGLLQDWFGLVFCNPPYGPHVGTWARKMSDHKNGIMLIFARLETNVWQHDIFPTADGFLFPDKRISFCLPNGRRGSSAGAPSVFVAWGGACRSALLDCVYKSLIPGVFFDKATMRR